MSRCRDCQHYNIESFRMANGKLRVMKNKGADCQFDMRRILRKFPHSISERARPLVATPRWMTPDEGNGCPQFVRREGGE